MSDKCKQFADLAAGVRLMRKMLDAVGDHLDEDEVHKLSCLVLTGLWRRSGFDRETFRDNVTAALLGLNPEVKNARTFARQYGEGRVTLEGIIDKPAPLQ